MYSKSEKIILKRLATGIKTRNRVLKFVVDSPNATDIEIAEALDVSPSTVGLHLKKMRDLDILKTHTIRRRFSNGWGVFRTIKITELGNAIYESEVGSQRDSEPHPYTQSSDSEDFTGMF